MRSWEGWRLAERLLEPADLEARRRWDTPTICNALEIVAPARRGRGFTLKPFTAADPALPPLRGAAGAGRARRSATAREAVPPPRRGRGFTLKPFTAADPALPPICGVARTGRIRAAAPSGRTREQDRDARLGWYEYVAAADLPTVVVLEDLDDTPGVGAFWGEVNTNVHKGLGVLGCVESGRPEA